MSQIHGIDLNVAFALMQHGYLWEDIKELAENRESFPDIARMILNGNIRKESEEADPYGYIQVQLSDYQPEQRKWTEREMATLYATIFRDKLRFNTTARQWYFYDGIIWREDTGGMHAANNAKLLADALIVYCASLQEEKTKADFLKFVSHYSKYSARKTLIDDAQSEMFISKADFDLNTNLYNCLNGTLDLSTMRFFPHDPKDMLSKLSNVIYEPSSKSIRFEKFISEIMCENEDKIRYLQKTLGYSLTADNSLETCWLWYGATTRNGKGTLAETFGYMNGNTTGYAFAISPETLAQRKVKDSRQASGDIARLDGCRFLNASEPPKRMLFDSALLKTLLGRDTITARHLYEREFEFIPQFKLFINTNYLPLIADDTLFSSGRINVLTFDKHFEPNEQDPKLKDTLKQADNISGIFNWCLEGLRMYRSEGLSPPECVISATKQYRESNDKLQNFIDDCLEITPGSNTGAGAAYKIYSGWCSANGYGIDSKRSFFDELKNKKLLADTGIVNSRTIHNVILGYSIIEEEPPLPEEPPF